MHIAPFAIEQFFAAYEFTTPYILCASDCESVSVAALLTLADRSLADLGELRLGYTESQGNPVLRQMIAHSTAVNPATPVSPDDVVVLAAPEEGIYLLMRTLLNPGDHVVVLTPAYNSLLQVAEHICGHVSQWEIQATDTGWRLDLEALDRLLTPQTRLLIVNFPHNPTGLLPTPAEFAAIITLARQRGVWLFCDEMYRGLELDGRVALPSAVTQYEKAIVLAGLSKAHGLPGLRAGWLILRDPELRAALINWKHYTTICAAAPSEFLAQAALTAQNRLMSRNREIISQNIRLAEVFFARQSRLFTWRRPQAGSVALVQLHVPDVTAYCHHLARQAGVLLLPGQYIGYQEQFVRWGFGRLDFAANLGQLEAFLTGVPVDAEEVADVRE